MRGNCRGILIPIGGNEDKGLESDQANPEEFITEGILSHVIRESRGTESKIVVIPSASSIPKQVSKNYIEAFKQLGCDDVSISDMRRRSDADTETNIRLIKEADVIMMSGGDQSKLSKIVSGSEVHKVLMNRYLEDKVVIAGTSAGAVAMSEEMITGGSPSESLIKGAVQMGGGLGLLPELIIDSHFVKRGRFGRLAEAVARKTDLLGIGLGEDTGVIIKNGDLATVIGSGMVILFDPAKLSHNKHDELHEGTPMSMSNLIVHILSNGDEFSIRDRSINILPIHERFI